MTSKSLCFKLMREDLKRRMWTIALTVLGFVFTLLVPVALESSSYMDQVAAGNLEIYEKERLVNVLISLVGVNGIVIALLLGAAVVWAVSGFRYLHNSRQVDFYHSIPVKRHQLFIASYLNGILVPMIIYLAAQILSAALILRTGIGAHTLGSTWWKMFLLNLVYYSMIYTTAVIAMMMTGNIIIALLGTAVFCGYGPAVVSLVMIYKSEWFATYYETEAQVMAWRSAVNFSSPFANYMFAVADFSYDSLGLQRVAGAAVVTGALAVAAYALYRIRPSESAGKAMAFRKTESPIKHLIALPVGVVFGMFFYGLRSTAAWAVFGVLCGTVLTCCIMEIIYHFDFRKLFTNWIHLAACFGISLLFVLAGMYDWYGYDSWLPDAGSIKSAAVVFSYDDDWVTYGDVKMDTIYSGKEVVRWDYESQEKYGFDHMELTDIYTVVEVGKKGVESARKGRSRYSESWISGERCVVEYRFNNGKKAYRQYRINTDDLKPLKTAIYDSKEYKEGIYPVLSQTSSETVKVCFQQYNQREELNLTGDDTAHLLAVYQKELEELAMSAREKELPIGTIQFRTRKLEDAIEHGKDNGYDYNMEDRCYYPIYPSFTRTIDDLKKAGVEFLELNSSTISDIRLRYYWTADQVDGREEMVKAVDFEDSQLVIYNEKEDVESLIPALVFTDYWNMNSYYEMETPENADAYVTVSFDISQRYSDRNGGAEGFLINMKNLSEEDIKRFGLVRYEDMNQTSN